MGIVNIRKARQTDLEAIHELGKSVSEFSVNNKTVTFWPKEVLSSAIDASDVLVLVAEEQSVAGFIIVACNIALKKALIENIYVHPDHRSQGVGDLLLSCALELAQRMGCEYIATLIPPDAQDAAQLYIKNGFSRGERFLWLDKTLTDTFKK